MRLQGLDEYVALMRRCWVQQPLDRPGFDHVAADLRCVRPALPSLIFMVMFCTRTKKPKQQSRLRRQRRQRRWQQKEQRKSAHAHKVSSCLPPCMRRSLLDRTVQEMGTMSMLSPSRQATLGRTTSSQAYGAGAVPSVARPGH